MKKKNNKKSKKITPLKEKLNQIYNTVNLKTTCKGNVECCKTACPQMNYCEFSQLLTEIWDKETKTSKLDMICKSIEYFFVNEFDKWNKDIFYKPCMLLNDDGKCAYYTNRPLSCRMYGLWPEKTYDARVDKFEKMYEGMMKREELPLNRQCPYVKRVDDSIPLTDEIIDGLYKSLDDLDQKIASFSDLQVERRENYRTFHDWLLLKVFGEEWITGLTQFMIGAKKELIQEQIKAIQDAVVQNFSKNMPKLK